MASSQERELDEPRGHMSPSLGQIRSLHLLQL